MEKKRSSFTGKIGFVLAAAGSAVGLGNIWRFPYLAAKYGGGIFLLVYIVLAITFGFSLMCAEIALGRKTGKSAIGAFSEVSKKYKFIGLLASVVPIMILPYYSVIGGWVAKYLFTFSTGGIHDAAKDGYFDSFISQPIEPIGWFLLFIGLTALVVLFGVEKGVEKVSKLMMPVLVLLTLGIAVYSLFMPNAFEGFLYYVTPDFSKFSATTVLAAMGQLFYSMSLAMGIMITYGSYMKKDVNIESSVHQIELFDTGIAFLAGMMIIPAVFSFSGGDESALGKGPGLMFVTLPKVFDSINGIGGSIVGILFFLLVLFAALTSSISLMETVVSIFRDKFGWGRKSTCLFVFIGSVLLGLPSSLGFGVLSDISIAGMTFLDMFDFASNSVLMPIVALLTCFYIGYIIKPKTIIEEISGNGRFKGEKLFTVMIKYIAPLFIVLILVTSVLDVLGIMKI
ncbi:MAG: sodium-dependent transporter [Clostridia bacterium]|nr:sodium-dependent transporter [Clostridia bacterium]